jgi:cell envelope-related function transcriptional attenuator common domain
MRLPARRLFMGVLLIMGLVGIVYVARIGYRWNRAISDVNQVFVTSVTLPNLETPVPTTAAHVANQPTQLIPSPTPEPPLPDGTTTILLMGTDARPTDTEPTRTDALVLVHLNWHDNKVSMLSLPRDLWVTYPGGYGEGRINAAYARGEKQMAGGGPELAKATVSELTGLKVDYFIMMNFTAFKTVIDELGGISINVPKEIIDPNFPTDDYRTIEVHFKAGEQIMDGERALIYARTRHADSDFGRNQRQQEVLMAIFKTIREKGLFDQITNIDRYTSALRDHVKTDLPRSMLFDLARLGAGLDPDRIHRYAIDSQIIYELKDPATFAVEPKELRKIIGQITGDAVSSAGGTEQK